MGSHASFEGAIRIVLIKTEGCNGVIKLTYMSGVSELLGAPGHVWDGEAELLELG